MFEGTPIENNIDDQVGLPDDDAVVSADVIELESARLEAEREGDGVEDPDFTADELEQALADAQREAA